MRRSMRSTAALMVPLRRITLALAAEANLVDMDVMRLIGKHLVGLARHAPTIELSQRFVDQGWAYRTHQQRARALNRRLVPLVRRGDAELAAGHVERARVLFEEALAGYREEGRDRPKLADKIARLIAHSRKQCTR